MRKVIITLLILLCGINIYQLLQQILKHQARASDLQLHHLGDQFRGLESIVSKMPRIGYFTDKNIDHPLAVAQFEQAQYHLAPTILELNKTDYPLVIFDCSSPSVALQKIKELGLEPVKANQFGVIIAINPKL